MALRLTIENFPNLPDGGPISFTADGERPIDIGRSSHLDWTLPDPTRYISSKHCEIRYVDNCYWLHDVSTNGTFLNGSEHRMRSPYQLRDGDRLIIGQYIIATSLDQDDASRLRHPPAHNAGARPGPETDVWGGERSTASTADFQATPSSNHAPPPPQSSFQDWTADLPNAGDRVARPRPRQPNEGARTDWANGNPFDIQPAAQRTAPDKPDDRAADATNSIADVDTAPTSAPQAEDVFTGAQGPAASVAPAEKPDTPSIAKRPVAPRRDMQAGTSNLGSIIAHGAALPETAFANCDDERLAYELGQLMRMAVVNLMILLQARNEAKRLTRSRTHTTVEATENNPLKLAPSPDEAMRILFGPSNHAYLEAANALEQGFDDLRVHQQQTYAAMQHAVSTLMATLDPAEIAKQAQDKKGILDKVRSQKGRLWDTLVERWNTNFGGEIGATIDAFMVHFAEQYDQTRRR